MWGAWEYSMAKQIARDSSFNNATDLTFTDISSEQWREYQFLGGDTVQIERPLQLNVSDSGGHRVFDAEGVSHYVPSGWFHLTWIAKGGAPNFVK